MHRYARATALLVLAVVTVYGVYQFLHGDWGQVSEYWGARLWLVPLVLLFAIADVALEGVCWAWVYERFGIKAFDRRGFAAFIAGRAGLLLPAQLGRLIRPDAMVRLERGSARECFQAEAVVFVLDVASVFALIAGLLAYQIHPLLAPLGAAAVVFAALLFGNLVADRHFGTHIVLPRSVWWSWQTFAIVLVEMVGWTANGLALWVMVREVAASLALHEVLLYAAGSAVLGVGTGLPGGIGATELFLGLSLSLGDLPADHLFVIVGAFRVLTFWIWIPLGWAALAWPLRRKVSEIGQATGDEELAPAKAASSRPAP